MKQLVKVGSCKPIEFKVSQFYEIYKSNDYLTQVTIFKNKLLDEIRKNLLKFNTPVLYTSRKLFSIEPKNEQILFCNLISKVIAQLVADLRYEIGYLISKGGITSNMILSNGFNSEYVYLEGQIFNGISLVTVKLNNLDEKIPVVTFPGNIGSDDALLNVWNVLERKVITEN